MATKKNQAADGKKGSVISVMRGINVTDAPMSSWLPNQQAQAITVIRHGIRGTQNVMSSKDVSNPQTTETAKTSADAIGMQIQFSLQTTPIRRLVVACDQPEERQKIDAFLLKAESSEELMELCRRYARRIMTGSFFWRNLTLAQELEITASCEGQSVSVQGVQSFDLAARGFNDYAEAEITLAQWLQRSFTTTDHLGNGIQITAKLKFSHPGAMEVYPSQVYVSDKPKGFARPLYKLDPISPEELVRMRRDDDARTLVDSIPTGKAALRDQKIGNAIRTIDTWYADGDVPPIAIEPNGASLSSNTFYRDFKSGRSFFDIRPRLAELTADMKEQGSGTQPSPEAMFMLAVFIRGGVLGDSKE